MALTKLERDRAIAEVKKAAKVELSTVAAGRIVDAATDLGGVLCQLIVANAQRRPGGYLGGYGARL